MATTSQTPRQSRCLDFHTFLTFLTLLTFHTLIPMADAFTLGGAVPTTPAGEPDYCTIIAQLKTLIAQITLSPNPSYSVKATATPRASISKSSAANLNR